LALVGDEGDELGHRRTEAAASIGLLDPLGGGQRRVAIRQHLAERWFVSHEDPDVLRVAGDESERVDGAATGGEEIDRSAADRLDHRVHIVRVLVGC
jgi:hypothetical protein